ncbi:hypothetical protein BD779DRAFT_1147809 [Infundibulicybe gibba]|nr:hypothetical protein BD779DRAFT_1147809 [Infundibulicybe gibba]
MLRPRVRGHRTAIDAGLGISRRALTRDHTYQGSRWIDIRANRLSAATPHTLHLTLFPDEWWRISINHSEGPRNDTSPNHGLSVSHTVSAFLGLDTLSSSYNRSPLAVPPLTTLFSRELGDLLLIRGRFFKRWVLHVDQISRNSNKTIDTWLPTAIQSLSTMN